MPPIAHDHSTMDKLQYFSLGAVQIRNLTLHCSPPTAITIIILVFFTAGE